MSTHGRSEVWESEDFVRDLAYERKRLGQCVQELRKGRGITQEQLAERSGLHISFIGRIERAEMSASLTAIVAIKRVFKCKWSELFSDG